MNKTNPMVATIVIIDDPGEEERGYSLLDREFYIRYPGPVKGEGAYNDGQIVEAEYYVVSLEEYMRVVPEASNSNEKFTKDIFIPTYLATMSFKPSYVK